jgi:uncharacterized protein
MLFRLLLLFLIVWFLIWMLKRQFGGSSASTPHQPSDDAAEDMVQCAYCATHVPRSLAIQQRDRYYCSHDHAEKDIPA